MARRREDKLGGQTLQDAYAVHKRKILSEAIFTLAESIFYLAREGCNVPHINKVLTGRLMRREYLVLTTMHK